MEGMIRNRVGSGRRLRDCGTRVGGAILSLGIVIAVELSQSDRVIYTNSYCFYSLCGQGLRASGLLLSYLRCRMITGTEVAGAYVAASIMISQSTAPRCIFGGDHICSSQNNSPREAGLRYSSGRFVGLPTYWGFDSLIVIIHLLMCIYCLCLLCFDTNFIHFQLPLICF